MNITKRLLSMFLAVVIVATSLVIPAHADSFYTRDFPNFPRVNISMSGYMVATVAIQKFLMLYGDSLAKKIMAAGGTDGYFGLSTKEAVATFQSRTGLTSDGDVGSKTWEKIGSLLEIKDIPEVCVEYSHRNRSYYDLDTRVIISAGSYFAVNQHGNSVQTPFYPY